MITEKVCSKCKVLKPLTDYNKGNDTALGVKSQCRNCQKEEEEKRRRLSGVKQMNRIIKDGKHHKVCKTCKELFEITDFYKMGNGYSSNCKVCHSLKNRQKTQEYKEDLLKNNPELYEEIQNKRKENYIKGGLSAIPLLNIYNSTRAKEKWDSIIEKGEMQCSRCKEVKPLKEYRLARSFDIEKRGYLFYASHCNLCDSSRAADYKNKKIETIEGKVDFLMNNLNRRVRDRDLECDVDKEFILNLWQKQEGKCFYTGVEMELGKHKEKKDFYNANFNVISIDRFDSSKGYTKDNTILCCWGVNKMKQEMSYEELLKWCSLILDKHNKTPK